MPRIPPAEFVELELKVRLDPGVALPAIELPGVAVRPGRVLALDAIYHDTPDARLARAGVILRRRTGGADEGWHLKLESRATDDDDDDDEPPPAFDCRLELHLPLTAGEVGAPPPQLLDVVAALTRGEGVLPLARVQTRRRQWELLALDGASNPKAGPDPIAVVCDDAVVTSGIGRDGSLHRGAVFREVEVEIVPGPDGRAHPAAAAVAEELRQLLGGLGATPSPRSKGAEALGARASGEPDVVVGNLGAEASVAELLRAAIARHVRALVWADGAVRRGAGEGIHDFRVAARRLRSLLGTFGPVLEADWARELRRELKWAAGAFGVARDTEVQLEILDADANRLRNTERALVSRKDARRDAALARTAIASVLTPRFMAARSEALGHLRMDRYLRLLELLVAAAREPRVVAEAAAAGAPTLAPFAARAEAELWAACGGLRVGRDPVAWHRARILAKRARYAAEVLALVPGGEDHARSAERLADVTSALGAIHDAHVSRETLREIALAGGAGAGAAGAGAGGAASAGAGHRSGRRAAYLLGVLDGVAAARERELQESFLAGSS